MILVTGATGNFGKATIQFLLQKEVSAGEIVALVRDEKKAANLKAQGVNIRIGDYDNYDSLKNAFIGVEKLLLISSNEPFKGLEQQVNVINAAKESGVKHIVYTALETNNIENSAIPFVTNVHKETSDYIEKSGFLYTIMNDTLYADSIEKFIGENFLETGIFFPAGDGKVPFLPRIEMAEAAAEILTNPGHENKTYSTSAETAYSFQEIADHLSEITGKKVDYLKPDVDTFINALLQQGAPKEMATFFCAFGTAMANGEFNTGKSDIEKLLGRKSMGLKAFLQMTFGKGY